MDDIDGRITAISPTKRDPARLTIRVDGKVVATFDSRHAEVLQLAVGMPWSASLAEAVTAAAAYDKAWRDALRRIERRMMSRRRLGDRLRQRGHEVPTIEQVLDRLEELAIIDDVAFARHLAESWRQRGGAGPRMVAAKLQQRGITRQAAEQVVGETFAGGNQGLIDDATALVTKRKRSMTRLDPAVRKRRLWGMLARRGYDNETIQAALSGVDQTSDDDC